MSVTYSLTVRNNRLQQVINAIDGGSGSGKLQIGIAGIPIVISTIVLAKPCATIAAGILTFSGLPILDASAAFAGTPTEGRITDSAGTIVISGLTVGTVGTNLIITPAVVSAGDPITFSSGTITGN